jgi:hypothetical protein
MLAGMLKIVLLIILISILVVLVYYWFVQLKLNHNKYTIGFLPTISPTLNKELVKISHRYIPNQAKFSFVELGSGVANITAYMSKNTQFKSYIAVELDWLTIQFGKLINFFKTKQILYIQKNVFDYTLPHSSFVYCFLGGAIIDRLADEGGFENCLVVSASFPLSKIKPTETIPLKNFYKNLYIYDFRK